MLTNIEWHQKYTFMWFIGKLIIFHGREFNYAIYALECWSWACTGPKLAHHCHYSVLPPPNPETPLIPNLGMFVSKYIWPSVIFCILFGAYDVKISPNPAILGVSGSQGVRDSPLFIWHHMQSLLRTSISSFPHPSAHYLHSQTNWHTIIPLK